MMNQYAYIRISTLQQNTDRQTLALSDFQIPEDHIFTDKQSGKDFDRPQYKKMISRLAPGDVLIVKSIDRLGRNYNEILKQWQLITKEIGADIVVIDLPLLDTRKKERDITGTFIADLVLQILAYVAETERQNTLQRTREGIAAARKRGVKLGRPMKEIPAGFLETMDEWKKQKITLREAAKRMDVDRKTFKKWVGVS